MLPGGKLFWLSGVPSWSLRADMTIKKIPPSNCPAVQKIVDVTSGPMGNVTSAAYSSVTGKIAKDEAPRTARMTSGAMMLRVGGAKRRAR